MSYTFYRISKYIALHLRCENYYRFETASMDFRYYNDDKFY